MIRVFRGNSTLWVTGPFGFGVFVSPGGWTLYRSKASHVASRRLAGAPWPRLKEQRSDADV